MAVTNLCDAHVIVINRWRDRYAEYADYIDHSTCRVTYVTTVLGRQAVPEEAAGVMIIDDINNFTEVSAAVDSAVFCHGSPSAIIALQEGDFPAASRLREELGTAGRKPADLHHFLNKHAMLLSAERVGVRVPRFELVTGIQELDAFAARVGWPVVVKPLHGRASVGVRRLDNLDGAVGIEISEERPMLAQEYLPYRVYHADGLFTGSDIGPWRLSTYENMPDAASKGPLAFMLGEPVGSVEIDDPATCATVEGFLRLLLPGLSEQPWVFHLELFIVDSTDGPECVFLEVGCRPGGGEIPFIWRDVHHIDLMGVEFALQCGQMPKLRSFSAGEPVGGCLLVPLSGPRPCRIVAAPTMRSPSGPYAEAIPTVGELVPRAEGSYEFIGGRFRFRGRSTAEVTRKVIATATNYQVLAEPTVDHDLVEAVSS